MSCRVAGCRFKHNHTTSFHICGNCSESGHGQMECGDNVKCQALTRFFTERLPNNLSCEYCHSVYHTKESHRCNKCLKYHSESECIVQTVNTFKRRFPDEYEIQLFNEHKMANEAPHASYVKLYAGMGCWVYIVKGDDPIYALNAIFMHSDNWGQYGVHLNDEPTLKRYIDGCQQISSANFIDNVQLNNTKKCPICRTENLIDEVKNIFGSTDKCSICLDENVSKFFGSCGHACTCANCFNQLEMN